MPKIKDGGKMANTDGQIILGLDIPKTVKQINADIKSLQNQLAQVKATGALDTSATVKQINVQITALQSQLKTIDIKANINTTDAQKTGQKAGQAVADATQKAIDNKNINIDKLNADVKILVNNLNSFSNKNAGFDSFKTEINGVEVSLDSLISKLSTVDDVTVLGTIRSQAAALKTAFTELAQVNKIQLSMTDKSAPKDNYELQIKKLTDQLSNLGLTNEEVSQKTRVLTESQAELKKVIDSTNYNSINEKNQAILSADEKRSTALNQVKNAYEDAKLAYDKYMQPVSNEKATSLINRINTFLSKNTKITKDARIELEGFVQELGRGDTTLNRWNQINGTLKKTENSMRGLHRLGASLKEQMSQAAQSFTQWLSISSAVMLIVSKTRNAISELKEINTLLTEISKANDKLSKSDLNKIGNNSFDIASKYGKNATDYLSGVQEASRAGYENAEAIAELSVAAQGAGDMTDELANKYIIATDKAYKLGGSVEKLTEVLDGSNYITNHNAVNMTELAEAMSIVGSTAASFGVEANETTAVLGTMIATTQQSGSEMARAFRAILLNIRQVSDEEEGIDAEGLTKYEKACNALGVSLKETKDGILQTRDAMEVLRDLSVEYNQLEENDLRRTDLLNSVGGKLRANALDAILKNFDMYSKMLDEYAQGTGSMAVEAEKTANSWEGSMNRLGNTWKDTVENIADSDAIITIINCLNILLSVVNNVTDKLGSLGTIGLGAGLFAGFKNAGRVKCNPSQGICLL